MRRNVLPLWATAILAGLVVATGAKAAELTGGGAGASIYAPTGSVWYRGGNHWRGHHSLRWRYQNPDHLFSTPGWGAPWFYTPRTYYELARPRIVMPDPVAPAVGYGQPEPWTAQWYAYCSNRFRSFEPSTGLYTTYAGDKRMCW